MWVFNRFERKIYKDFYNFFKANFTSVIEVISNSFLVIEQAECWIQDSAAFKRSPFEG